MPNWNRQYPLLTGLERFTNNGEEIELNLQDFWRFQYSNIWDLQDDMAEFIVAKALGINAPFNRNGWSLYDIDYNDYRIEVKQTSDWHSWNRDGYVQKTPRFDIGKAHSIYKDVSSPYERQNDIYVFCHLKGNDSNTANPMNLSAWDFYVIPTKLINEKCGKSKTISLSRVKRFAYPVLYNELHDKIDAVIEENYGSTSEQIINEDGYPYVEWLAPCTIFIWESSALYEHSLKELDYNLDFKYKHFDFPYEYFKSQLKEYKNGEIKYSSEFCKKEYLRLFELGFMFGATKRHAESKQFVFSENNQEKILTQYRNYSSYFMRNFLQLKREEFYDLGEELYKKCFLRVNAKEVLKGYPKNLNFSYEIQEQFHDEMYEIFEIGCKLAFTSKSW